MFFFQKSKTDRNSISCEGNDRLRLDTLDLTVKKHKLLQSWQMDLDVQDLADLKWNRAIKKTSTNTDIFDV